MDYGINTSAAPASTLGSVFDNDDRRRYSGGTLQRARPAPRRGSGDAMDVSSDGSVTPPATSHAKKPSPTSNVIDPNLEGGSTSEQAPATPATVESALKSPASVSVTEEVKDQRYNAWLENMRLIEYLRELVKRMKEEWPESRIGEGEDVDMGESSAGPIDAVVAAAAKVDVSYPSLKEVAV